MAFSSHRLLLTIGALTLAGGTLLLFSYQNGHFRYGVPFMSLPYASTDPAVVNFVAAQNAGPAGRGGTGPYTPTVMNNGIAGNSADNVTGFSSLSSNGSAISMGSGFNAVILDGANSSSAAITGTPDAFSFTVDPTGLVTLTDTSTHQTQQISGVSFLIFNGAALGTDQNGNPDYQQMFYIGGASQTEVTELYYSALGRQPDLGGVEYYMKQLASGLSFTDLATEFMGSTEFKSRYGASVTDSQFVANLYQNVLHRTPSATESGYYTAALANFEAGSVVNSANTAQWSRTQILLNFTISPENQSDVAGFVINTSTTVTNGLVYTTPAVKSLTGTQLLAQALATGNIDTTLLDPAHATTSTTAPALGSVAIDPSVPSGTTTPSIYDATVLRDYTSGGVITLSDTVPNVATAADPATFTVNGRANGGDYFAMSGGTVNLHGSNNYIWEQGGGKQPYSVVPVLTVNGWTSGDYLLLANTSPKGLTYNFLTPSTSSPIQGVGGWGMVVYVGDVGGGSPAEVVAAANKVYQPSDGGGEQAIFYGQISSGPNAGGTAIFDWFNYSTAPAGADTHNDHQVHTDNSAGMVILTGVAASSFNASFFERF